jgi:hypothetical protein
MFRDECMSVHGSVYVTHSLRILYSPLLGSGHCNKTSPLILGHIPLALHSPLLGSGHFSQLGFCSKTGESFETRGHSTSVRLSTGLAFAYDATVPDQRHQMVAYPPGEVYRV